MTEKKTKKRTLQGTVVSTKMDKTALVRVDRMKLHSKYKKQYKTSRNYKVHDEQGVCQVGDVVRFEETRPLSKDKRWRYVSKVTAGQA
jgi:small subunit ribosomal protein S17